MAVGVIWGIPYLLLKVGVGALSPAPLVFFRTLIAALLLLPLAAARGQLGPLLRHWKALLAFTAIEVAIPWFFLASAEQRLSSSLAGLLIAAGPPVGAPPCRAARGGRPGPPRPLRVFLRSRGGGGPAGGRRRPPGPGGGRHPGAGGSRGS